jgi:transposase
LATEKPPVFGMIQRAGEVVIRRLENVQQTSIQPIMQAIIAPGTLVYPDEYRFTTDFLPGAMGTKRLTMGKENRRATKPAMAVMKFMSTPWRGFGLCCDPGYDRTGVFPKKNCPFILVFSSSCIT